jgi:hypothetical protein
MDQVDRRVRLIRIASIVVLSLGGLAIGRVGVSQTWEAWQSRAWVTVPGVILSSDTTFDTVTSGSRPDDINQRNRGVRQERTKDVWTNRLTYSFEFEGRPFEGHQIAVADVPTDNHTEVSQVAERYAAGTHVTVHVHPTDPTRSVLEPGITFGAVGPLIIGAVVCFCMAASSRWVMSKCLVSLVEAVSKPPGSYLVGEDGRLVPLRRKGKPREDHRDWDLPVST